MFPRYIKFRVVYLIKSQGIDKNPLRGFLDFRISRQITFIKNLIELQIGNGIDVKLGILCNRTKEIPRCKFLQRRPLGSGS